MNMYMKMLQLTFACEALEDENQKLQIRIQELNKKMGDYQDINRKLHSKLREERFLKEKILKERNAETTKETKFGLKSKFASSSNIKENKIPSAQSNTDLDSDELRDGSKKSNSADSVGDEEEVCLEPSTEKPAHEKVNKGCQCSPNGTSWISTEDLKLVLESLNRHQSDLLKSCLHPIEDIPAAAISQIPALTTQSTTSKKKSKKSKRPIDVNDVD